MHFIQVFRCAKKTGLVKPETDLEFLGFGTMNGKDGKPFKTREGGVMRLEYLISDINEKMYQKIAENPEISEEEARETARKIGLSAIKYGDLSNQASKGYVFDIDRFTSFEGNTGPYILYTIVRIKSILNKYQAQGGDRQRDGFRQRKMTARKRWSWYWRASMAHWRMPLTSWRPIRSALISMSWRTPSTSSIMRRRFLAKRMKRSVQGWWLYCS